jgi:hypothetical protein
METQYYIPPSHDLLREGFTFTFTQKILGCVSPRAGLDDMEKTKYLVPFLCLLELAIKSHGT